jgi:hypothetical protein
VGAVSSGLGSPLKSSFGATVSSAKDWDSLPKRSAWVGVGVFRFGADFFALAADFLAPAAGFFLARGADFFVRDVVFLRVVFRVGFDFEGSAMAF